MRATFTLANTSGSFNTKCVMQRNGSPSDCIFPQNFAEVRYFLTRREVTD
jgi:hypothetical protein